MRFFAVMLLEMRFFLAVMLVQLGRPNEPSFAVCFVGQLRTLTEPGLQENLAKMLVEPLEADLFFVVSRRHEIAHAAGAGGCLQADSGMCESSDYTSRMRRRTRRADATDDEVDFLRRGPLGRRTVHFAAIEDGDAIRVASALDESRGPLVQKALRARCRLCLEAIERVEARAKRPYDYVVRTRPDYALFCAFPPKTAALWKKKLSSYEWASTHRDYWEVVTRSTADALLRDLWVDGAERLPACRPYGDLPELATRVEACAYFALCAAGAVVQAADRYDDDAESPGIIVRPCCNATATHRSIRRGLPSNATCDFDRVPVLGQWFLGSAARHQAEWTTLRTTLLETMRPHCEEQLPSLIPPMPGDDDDDRGELR